MMIHKNRPLVFTASVAGAQSTKMCQENRRCYNIYENYVKIVSQ